MVTQIVEVAAITVLLLIGCPPLFWNRKLEAIGRWIMVVTACLTAAFALALLLPPVHGSARYWLVHPVGWPLAVAMGGELVMLFVVALVLWALAWRHAWVGVWIASLAYWLLISAAIFLTVVGFGSPLLVGLGVTPSVLATSVLWFRALRKSLRADE